MSVKITKTAEADLGKFGDVPVTLEFSDGKTKVVFGFATVSVSDIKGLVRNINEALLAIGETPIC